MRRKRKNPLLLRIVLFSILLHAIALPILAHYGAFKKIQQQYFDAKLVTLPPPPREEVKKEPKPPKRVEKKTVHTPHRSAEPAHQNQPAERRTSLNIPKVMATGTGAGAGGGEPSVEANGTGKVGEVPTEASTPGPAAPPPAPAPAPPPAPTPAAPPTPAPPTPAPPPPHPAPAPSPPAPQVAEVPKPALVFTQASPTYAPQPAIPDDLRGEDFDKTFVAEFNVGPDGSPISVKMVQSTGIEELDRIALDAAKQWKFKPATRDGQPVESVVRLTVEFQVNG